MICRRIYSIGTQQTLCETDWRAQRGGASEKELHKLWGETELSSQHIHAHTCTSSNFLMVHRNLTDTPRDVCSSLWKYHSLNISLSISASSTLLFSHHPCFAHSHHIYFICFAPNCVCCVHTYWCMALQCISCRMSVATRCKWMLRACARKSICLCSCAFACVWVCLEAMMPNTFLFIV